MRLQGYPESGVELVIDVTILVATQARELIKHYSKTYHSSLVNTYSRRVKPCQILFDEAVYTLMTEFCAELRHERFRPSPG